MFSFIICIFFIVLIVSFPYEKAYIFLSKFVDLRLLSTAILLISIPIIRFLLFSGNADVHNVTSADNDELKTRMILTLNACADVFGWLCLFIGVIILLIVATQAVAAIRENKKSMKN
ncbi:hypothetical protein ACWXWE_21950 [Pantoea ananatis]